MEQWKLFSISTTYLFDISFKMKQKKKARRLTNLTTKFDMKSTKIKMQNKTFIVNMIFITTSQIYTLYKIF